MDANTPKPIPYLPSVFRLSSGFLMFNDITENIASCAWNLITDEQRDEFVALYESEEAAKQGIYDEIKGAEHKASFYRGTDLMALMWSGWERDDDGKCYRTLGCVTTRSMRRQWMQFAKHSMEMCEAYMLNEPPSVNEIFVAIQTSYKQSCEWARRMCGFRQVGLTQINGEPFTIFMHRIGGER